MNSCWYTTTANTDTNFTLSTNVTDTFWYPVDDYTVWPKGVLNPDTEVSYIPKWHILLGYRYQIKRMWD